MVTLPVILNLGTPMTLQEHVIKLATEHPEFRASLVPLIRMAMHPTFPRDFYVPKEVRDKPPLVPEGTDLAIWTYEGSGPDQGYYAVAFAGKANKPLWHHRFRDEQSRQRKIDETTKARKIELAEKEKQEEARRTFQHDFKEGDILYSSWGYDQTNIDWYQVTKVIGKAVEIRQIGSKIVGGTGGPSEAVVPVPNAFDGPPMRKVPRGPAIRLTSYSIAQKWDGRPKHQTGSGWGH